MVIPTSSRIDDEKARPTCTRGGLDLRMSPYGAWALTPRFHPYLAAVYFCSTFPKVTLGRLTPTPLLFGAWTFLPAKGGAITSITRDSDIIPDCGCKIKRIMLKYMRIGEWWNWYHAGIWIPRLQVRDLAPQPQIKPRTCLHGAGLDFLFE